MSTKGDPGLVESLLFGEAPAARLGAPEPELISTLAPFLRGDLLERGCEYARYALRSRSFERPLGTELLRSFDAVARRLAAEGGTTYGSGTLEWVFEEEPQPLARPVWEAAVDLAHTLQQWEPIGTVALAPWSTTDLPAQAREAEGAERAALYAALLAVHPTDELVREAADVAKGLDARAHVVLLAWCASAVSAGARLELEPAALRAFWDQVTNATLAAAVGLTAPGLLPPVVMNRIAATVPDTYRDVGLLAEWLEQSLPEPPPERRLWRRIQGQLAEELPRLDDITRNDLLERCLEQIVARWGGAILAAPVDEDTGEIAAPATGEPAPAPPPAPSRRGLGFGRRVAEGVRALGRSVLGGVSYGYYRRYDPGEETDWLESEPDEMVEREAARVLNVALTDAEQQVLPESAALAPKQEYFVRIDIGAHAAESVVVNPTRIPTERLEPSTPDGYWLDVVVASSEVDVDADLHRLFLPMAGSSWVCDCQGADHVCSPEQRRPFLHVPIRTRATIGPAALRCTVYDRNNAVQSVRVDFAVGDGKAMQKIRGVVDFSLAEDVGAARGLESRTLSVLTNESPAGTHKIVVNSGERAVAVDLTEAEAQAALGQLRAKLREITVGTDASPAFDEQNRRESKEFVQDLKQLALLGSVLWGAIVPCRDDRRYLREQLAHRATIQIARVGKVVFPWALVYDIPRELAERWTLCPLLEQWEAKRGELATYPENCPYESAHRANVLCPYGFWGFRHLIEQPPSVRQGVLRTAIQFATPGRAAAARSLALDPALTTEHFTELHGCLDARFDLDTCDSRTALRQAFADPSLPLVYFYCHGKTAELAGTTLAVPFLEIGGADKIGPNDFAAWDEDDDWGPSHWETTAPLVFINGCETTKLSPEDLVTFVDALAGMNAAGVVGTEIPVRQRVAGEVALLFYRGFVGDSSATVGEALYRTRIDLLAKGNVSGLVYTPFCSMDLALVQQRTDH